MMRLILFADLHLDAAFAWAPAEVARRRRQALHETLRKIMALADEVNADAILAAGDLYEQDRFSADTAAFLQSTFGSTSKPVYVAPGNHDWFGSGSLYNQVSWSSNVTIFEEPHLVPRELTEGVTLWGAAHRGPANTPGFLSGGFRVDRDGVHLALFHGSEQAGFALEGENKALHAPFSANEVPDAGLHHVFVGHYHVPREERFFTYPGNPDPLTFGESGLRGAVVIDVHVDGTIRREWRRVGVSEVHDRELDVTGCRTRQDIIDMAREAVTGQSGALRITVKGELAPEVDFRTSDLQDTGNFDVVCVRTVGLNVAYDFDRIAEEATAEPVNDFETPTVSIY